MSVSPHFAEKGGGPAQRGPGPQNVSLLAAGLGPEPRNRVEPPGGVGFISLGLDVYWIFFRRENLRI